MPSAPGSPQAFSSSTIGDSALLDDRPGCIAAAHRACPFEPQYRPASPAGCCGGGCRSLPALRAVACRVALEPRRICAGCNPAQLAADLLIRAAPAGPDLGARQLGPL